MKTRYIIYVLWAVALFPLCSCSDFLEPKSQSEYIPKDANALQEMLIGSAYPKPAGGGYLLSYLPFFDDDIQFHKQTDYAFSENSTYDTEGKRVLFTWQPDMFITIENIGSNAGHNIWEGYYSNILGANAALDYIDDVSGTADEKNYVVAQALGLRGFYYFMLVNFFGAPYNYDKDALGVPLKLSSELLPEENIMLKRNTVEEVYNQILADLDKAEQLFIALPEDKQYQPDMLVSLPMVELLKSRVYLYMENWSAAKTYANKVIADWSFSLLDLNELPEPTRAEPYYNFTSIDSPEVIWLYGSINDLMSLCSENVMKEETDWWTGGKVTYYRNAFIASDDLLNSFEDGDLRKEKYIAKEYDRENLVFFDDSYSPYGKCKLSATGVPNGSENFALSFRLSEAYLNLAEAAAHDNDEATAINALTTLLEKRYESGVAPSDLSGLSGKELLSFIQQERRKELCFEGQRWFDLRRYGMPKITHTWEGKTYTLQEEDPSYTMPIPEEVLRKNTELVQNPLANKREY